MSEVHEPERLLAACARGDQRFDELAEGMLVAATRGPSSEQRARLRAALGLPPQPAPTSQPTSSAPASEPTAAATTGSSTNAIVRATLLALAIGASAWLGARWPIMREGSERLTSPPAQGPNPNPGLHPIPNPNPILIPGPIPGPGLHPIPVQLPVGPSAQPRSTASPAPTRTAVPADRIVTGRNTPFDPREELLLLKRARARMQSDPAAALALVAEHERRFADGILVQEREVIAVEALFASGDAAGARARARRFFSAFPESVHARRIHALLAEHSINRVPASHPSP